jgi:hypothetical protein
MASGSGCKSPAGRRRGGGDWSAGRSAASRDGRRALIARSQDLPCPGRLDATRERTGVYGPGSGPIHPPHQARPTDAAVSLLLPHPARSHTSRGSRSEEGHRLDRGAAFRERRRSPAVLPTSPLRTCVPHACPERPANAGTIPETERSPSACVGGRSMDGDARAISPVWTRSGSRPTNHGCSVRDPRPGSSLPTLRQPRSPFSGP